VPAGYYGLTLGASAVLSDGTHASRATAFALLIQAAAGTSVAAPATDATSSTIPASSISSTLTGATGGATGTITFKVFGPQASAPTSCATGGTTVGTATISANGTYNPSAAFTPTSAGTYWWFASYSGDTYDHASASACGSAMPATVVKNTTSAGASAPGNGVATAAIPAGSIGSVLSGATANAAGTVTFRVFGPQPSAPTDCSIGGTTVGSATVSGSGTYHPGASFTPAAGGTYWWYATYSGDGYNSPASSACGTSMASTVVQDFSIGASPATQTALTGGTSDDGATYTAVITPIGGFSGNVALSVSDGLPSGATATFSPASTSGSSTLAVDVGTNVAAGTYTLTVQGNATISGTVLTRNSQVTLTVQGTRPLAISGDVPGPLYPGAPAQTFPVTITNANTFPVHLTSLGSVGVQPVDAPGCLPSWFAVTLPAVPSGGTSIAAGTSLTLNAEAQMLDVNTPQDACAGRQLTLTYTGSYGK
jgi:hypothetical protein